MRITLPPRLKAIAEAVTKNTTAADIGTDHGYLPVYLIKQVGLEKVIATDVNEDPLSKARRIINRHGLRKQVELRQGDGLRVLAAGEAETIIIAGMGGALIGELLQASPEVAQRADRLILQPVQSVPELRRYLLISGYRIIAEKLIQEKFRFYEMIIARYEALPPMQPDPLLLQIGAFIRYQEPATAQAYLQRKIRLLERKRQGLLKAEVKDTAFIEETTRLIRVLKEELAWFLR
ncbi:MAG: class I SAM-dependent methyltransferase [Bacillota bacterium]|nr:class I SAM-dependent methyltransferase [Bacillota bacterium]MDW7676272.1 class I SAM-dependent methyltransferase [Bacillota bacterium]